MDDNCVTGPDVEGGLPWHDDLSRLSVSLTLAWHNDLDGGAPPVSTRSWDDAEAAGLSVIGMVGNGKERDERGLWCMGVHD
jgi:hypothetical protein